MAKRRSVSYYNSIKVYRREWRAKQVQRCMLCLDARKPEKLQVHEIDRKSQAPNNWWPLEDEDGNDINGCNGILTCGLCHATKLDTMPHAKQLAIKLISDPDHFNLKAWLSIKPRPSSYVTMEEVMEEVRKMMP